MTQVTFLTLGFVGLFALTIVLVIIGRAASKCPQIGASAHVGTLVITTGFVALGAAAIAIIGAFLPMLMEGQVNGLYLALGFVSLALGLGFSNAAIRLRDILNALPTTTETATAELQASL